MRRITAAALAMILAFGLSSCSFEDPYLDEMNITETKPEVERKADTDFGIAYTKEAFFNPLKTKNKINIELYSLVYEGLFEIDEKFEAVNLLCSDFTMNGNTYTFNIKQGVTFSDGSLLTAKDVEASLILAKQPESYYAPRLRNVVEVEAVSDTAVEVTVGRYTGNLPRLLDVPIIKGSSAEDEIPLGTGGYVLAKDEKGEYTLTARQGWHRGQDRPYAGIELVKVSGADELVFGFESRDIDVLTVDSTSADAVRVRGEYETRDYPTTTFQYLGFNCRNPLMANSVIRRAIACSIDRESAVGQEYANLADATTLSVHPVSPAYDEDMGKSLEFSLKKATDYLVYAGYSDSDGDGRLENAEGEKLEFEILVNEENGGRCATATRISSDMAKIGVAVNVVQVPWEEYLEALRKGEFDTYIAEINLGADFDISSIIRTGGMLNYGAYSSNDTNTLLDAFNAHTIRSGDTAAKFYKNFVLQAPIAPILFRKHTHITHKGAFESLYFTQRNTFYRFFDWKPVFTFQ